ncbi:MAG: hypothetical protein M0C28_22790 [Candidatus Moduliflexus flocculans]|nr:hypothetical protein [Candidatus Moduliflexus flocculans]
MPRAAIEHMEIVVVGRVSGHPRHGLHEAGHLLRRGGRDEVGPLDRPPDQRRSPSWSASSTASPPPTSAAAWTRS